MSEVSGGWSLSIGLDSFAEDEDGIWVSLDSEWIWAFEDWL